MDKVTGRLTVFFEDPFWVGIFERIEGDRLSACRVVFGAEPRDQEIWRFILQEYDQLRFSPSVASPVPRISSNPKRAARAAEKQLRRTGVGTRSQQALSLQRQAQKQERKAAGMSRRETKKELRFVKKQQKRKKKHRGH